MSKIIILCFVNFLLCIIPAHAVRQDLLDNEIWAMNQFCNAVGGTGTLEDQERAWENRDEQSKLPSWKKDPEGWEDGSRNPTVSEIERIYQRERISEMESIKDDVLKRVKEWNETQQVAEQVSVIDEMSEAYWEYWFLNMHLLQGYGIGIGKDRLLDGRMEELNTEVVTSTEPMTPLQCLQFMERLDTLIYEYLNKYRK